MGVRTKNNYRLAGFNTDHDSGLIESVKFGRATANNTETIDAPCVAFVNCDGGGGGEVIREVVEMVDTADLVWLDGLVVNERFETNDPDILAAGAGVRFSTAITDSVRMLETVSQAEVQ